MNFIISFYVLIYFYIITQLDAASNAKNCYRAKTCIHSNRERCGVTEDGTPRRFLDSCDIFEYNCLKGTDFVKTPMEPTCSHLKSLYGPEKLRWSYDSNEVNSANEVYGNNLDSMAKESNEVFGNNFDSYIPDWDNNGGANSGDHPDQRGDGWDDEQGDGGERDYERGTWEYQPDIGDGEGGNEGDIGGRGDENYEAEWGDENDGGAGGGNGEDIGGWKDENNGSAGGDAGGDEDAGDGGDAEGGEGYIGGGGDNIIGDKGEDTDHDPEQFTSGLIDHRRADEVEEGGAQILKMKNSHELAKKKKI